MVETFSNFPYNSWFGLKSSITSFVFDNLLGPNSFLKNVLLSFLLRRISFWLLSQLHKASRLKILLLLLLSLQFWISINIVISNYFVFRKKDPNVETCKECLFMFCLYIKSWHTYKLRRKFKATNHFFKLFNESNQITLKLTRLYYILTISNRTDRVWKKYHIQCARQYAEHTFLFLSLWDICEPPLLYTTVDFDLQGNFYYCAARRNNTGNQVFEIPLLRPRPPNTHRVICFETTFSIYRLAMEASNLNVYWKTKPDNELSKTNYYDAQRILILRPGRTLSTTASDDTASIYRSSN